MLDLDEFSCHRQQMILVNRQIAIHDSLNRLDLLLDQLSLATETDHGQGVRNDMHFGGQILEQLNIGKIAVDVDLQRRFDGFDIRLHCFCYGFEQGLVGTCNVLQNLAARSFRG